MASIVSHKHKFIFCHIPRTGGTSFTEFIKPYLGKDDEIEPFDKHQPLYAFKIGRIGKVFDQYRKISIIRHPYTRFLSLLHNNPPMSVENAVEGDEYWWSMKRWLCDVDGKLLCNYLMRFEELEDYVRTFMVKLVLFNRAFNYGVIPDQPFPHLNKGKSMLISSSETGKHKRLILEKYKEDFELFNYDRNTL